MFVLQDLHSRSKKNIKLALQEALISYLLLKGSIHMNAKVESAGEQHFVSFVGKLRSSIGELSDGEYSPYKLDENLRIQKISDIQSGAVEKNQ